MVPHTAAGFVYRVGMVFLIVWTGLIFVVLSLRTKGVWTRILKFSTFIEYSSAMRRLHFCWKLFFEPLSCIAIQWYCCGYWVNGEWVSFPPSNWRSLSHLVQQ